MTPNQIIAVARTQFGEDSALTLSDAAFQAWLNLALKELYNDLPPHELRNLIAEDVVSVVDGSAALDPSWDRVLEVLDADRVPLFRVDPESITFIDATGGNPYMTPIVGAFAQIGQVLVIRPTTHTSVRVQHQDPPAPVVFPGGGTTELTAVNARWHAPLAHLITSYAYQQEEDHNAAAHWRSRYSQNVGAGQHELAIPQEDQS